MTLSAPPTGDPPLSGEDRAERVREMFGRIAPRYDLANRLMTGGWDVLWRRQAAAAARPAGALALDVATGTGDLALELRRQGALRVVAADYCEPMLQAARRKMRRRQVDDVDLVLADALTLPFADGAFGCVASAFLLRNVVDLPRCLSEMRRLLRPGGRAVALEITRMPPSLVGRAIRAYLSHWVPRLGKLVSGDSVAYRYLPASIEPFPDADALCALFLQAGFVGVTYRRLGLGSVTIHVAETPSFPQ